MLRPLVLFPDVEAAAVNYLQAALTTRPETYTDGVEVSSHVPNPRRDRMVVVRRDGGQRLDIVREAPRLGVRAMALTDEDATDLARMVEALMHVWPDGEPVLRVRTLLGPSPIADESNQQVRYMTFEVTVRGERL